MNTRFTPDGDDIVIVDGGKIFITNGDVADLILLFGKWRGIADAAAGDLRADPRKGHARLPRPAQGRQDGAPRLVDRGARLRQLPLFRAPICWPDRAMACRCCSLRSTNRGRASPPTRSASPAPLLRTPSAISIERRQSGRRIVEFQGIQFLLADLATELAMCEAWLWHVAAPRRCRRGRFRGRSVDAQTARLGSCDADRRPKRSSCMAAMAIARISASSD